MSIEISSQEMEHKISDAREQAEKEFRLRKPVLEGYANHMIKVLAEANLDLNDEDVDAFKKQFTPVFTEIVTKYRDEGVRIDEINYVFTIVRQVIDQLENMMTVTINMRKNQADRKLWNVESIKDISLQDIDNVLQSKEKAEDVPNQDSESVQE